MSEIISYLVMYLLLVVITLLATYVVLSGTKPEERILTRYKWLRIIMILCPPLAVVLNLCVLLCAVVVVIPDAIKASVSGAPQKNIK